MRVLLVQPEFQSGLVGYRLVALAEPLALELLAAALDDHEVAILDMRLGDDLQQALERFSPDVVGVTALTTEVYAAQQVLRQAKAHSEEIFTVAGGHHATLMPEDFQLPFVDAVCLGEGELVFGALIESLARGRRLKQIPNLVWQDGDGGFVSNGRTHSRLDMDSLRSPRRDLVAEHRGEYFWLFNKPDSAIASSRGCPYRCNFCSVWEFYGGRTCQMSAGRVVEEVASVPSDHVTFVDDNFMLNYRRELAIADRLKAEGIRRGFGMECRTDSIVRHPDLLEKWVDVGLESILLGLEGASDKMLDMVNKKNSAGVNDEAVRILKANGVLVWGAFLVDPDWTADDFKALRDYVTRMEIGFMQFTILTPLPGTQLYREKYNELLTHDYRSFDALHSVLPTRLPREEFYQHYASLYDQPDYRPYVDLLKCGRVQIEDLKGGWEALKLMAKWELYAQNDPVLGDSQTLQDAGTGPAVAEP